MHIQTQSIAVKLPRTKYIFTCPYFLFFVHIFFNAILGIPYDHARTTHPWCDGCQIASNQSPKLALYDLSTRLRSLLSLSWNPKLCFYEIQNTWNIKCKIGLWQTEGGCCWLRSLWPTLAFMKHRNLPKSGPSKAFYKDEMGEQSGWWSSLKVVKSSCTEIRLSGGLCTLRKVILMGINGIGRREL